MTEQFFIQENGQKREATSSEALQIKKDQDAYKKTQEEIEARILSRESALRKLADLGLTEEEIAAL
jgi:hypothetical protein